MKDLVDIIGGEGARKSDLVDLAMVLHAETSRAVLVSSDGNEARAVWLPRSLVEIFNTGETAPALRRDGQRTRRQVVTVTFPEWLAKERGLL